MGLNSIVAALAVGYRDQQHVQDPPNKRRRRDNETSSECQRSLELRAQLTELESQVQTLNEEAARCSSEAAMMNYFYLRQGTRRDMSPLLEELLQLKCASFVKELETQFNGGNPLPFYAPKWCGNE